MTEIEFRTVYFLLGDNSSEASFKERDDNTLQLKESNIREDHCAVESFLQNQEQI